MRGPVKVQSVTFNNRRKGFEVRTRVHDYWFPYARLDPRPSARDPIVAASVDAEIGREGFGYRLRSGREGTVLLDQVLDYNRDPAYLRDLLLYRLTLEAQKRVTHSSLSRREIIRRLGTSATQFYRLLDQTNYRKSVDQVLRLLHVLDCEVRLSVGARTARGRLSAPRSASPSPRRAPPP